MLLTATQRSAFHRVHDAFVSFCQSEGGMQDPWASPACVDRFTANNPANLTAGELEQAQRWRYAVPGPFFVMRHTPSCTILMNSYGNFAVRGVDRELSELVPKTPTLVNVTLLPFDGLIVCADDPAFDEGAAGEADRAEIDATYRSLADKGVIYSAAAMLRAIRQDGGARARRSTIRHSQALGDASASPASEVPDDEAHLAPIEMLRPVARRRPAQSMPAGLAQIIAFKPRDAARVAYS